MKVSTDSLILGSWLTPGNATRVLDIGCGSGILALMQAQHAQPGTHIDAIDVDTGAVAQTRHNVAHSPWPKRVQVHHSSLAQWQPATGYDVIISNPPYFTDTNVGKLAHLKQSLARQAARQQQQLAPAALFAGAARLARAHTRFGCLYPTVQLDAIIADAAQAGWFLQRQLYVQSQPGSASHVSALLWQRNVTQPVREELVIRDVNHQYTAAFKALCQPFYLNF